MTIPKKKIRNKWIVNAVNKGGKRVRSYRNNNQRRKERLRRRARRRDLSL